MTDVVIFKDKSGHILGYEAKGHADFAKHGEDIVCAAISVLTQTALLSLNKVCNISEKDIEFELEDGYLSVFITEKLNYETRKCADIVLESMIVGLKSISEEYPSFITLKYREVD